MDKHRGFTILEISIVLTIIALIVGGVSIAYDMIRRSQIQTAIGESQRYIQIIADFQNKYHALPGDFSTASSFWSGAGNGDGSQYITTQGTAATYREQFYAWQHLVLANLAEGSFSGNSANGTGTHQQRSPGINIPASQLTGAGWGLLSVPLSLIPGTVSAIPYTNGDVPPNTVLWFGGISTGVSDITQAPVLTADEAHIIDEKLDDGLPGAGKVVAQTNPSGTACSSNARTYNLVSSDQVCALIFKTGL